MTRILAKTPEAPRRGDLVDLGEGPETAHRTVDRTIAYVWPLGQPSPSWFDVVDDEGKEHRVTHRDPDSPLRVWIAVERAK